MYESDLEKLLVSRHDNGADYWATPDGKLTLERPNRKLAGLSICARGAPSEAATRRYREIMANLEKRSEMKSLCDRI